MTWFILLTSYRFEKIGRFINDNNINFFLYIRVDKLKAIYVRILVFLRTILSASKARSPDKQIVVICNLLIWIYRREGKSSLEKMLKLINQNLLNITENIECDNFIFIWYFIKSNSILITRKVLFKIIHNGHVRSGKLCPIPNCHYDLLATLLSLSVCIIVAFQLSLV